MFKRQTTMKTIISPMIKRQNSIKII